MKLACPTHSRIFLKPKQSGESNYVGKGSTKPPSSGILFLEKYRFGTSLNGKEDRTYTVRNCPQLNGKFLGNWRETHRSLSRRLMEDRSIEKLTKHLGNSLVSLILISINLPSLLFPTIAIHGKNNSSFIRAMPFFTFAHCKSVRADPLSAEKRISRSVDLVILESRLSSGAKAIVTFEK